MKAILSETLVQFFPQTHAMESGLMEDLYAMPFDPEQLVLCFKGWEYYVPCDRYFDKSEDCNLVWFEEKSYFINGKAFKRPEVLGDFLADCKTLGIEVKWNTDRAFSLCRAMAA